MAIVGLGLMGGSLARALKGKCARIIGVDTDTAVLEKALYDQVIDAGFSSPWEMHPHPDAIILSAPIRAILGMLSDLDTRYAGGGILLDLGSTKTQITSQMEKLPERFEPIGGHPMCGKEISGYDQADALLYQNAPFALVRLGRTTSNAEQFAVQLAEAVGAYPCWMDAVSHDRFAAMTSHLPYIIANSLAAVTPLEAAALIGPGFISTTRLASSSIDMMKDIMTTNRNPVLAAIEKLQNQLSHAAVLLEAGEDQAWLDLFDQGMQQHRALLEFLEIRKSR